MDQFDTTDEFIDQQLQANTQRGQEIIVKIFLYDALSREHRNILNCLDNKTLKVKGSLRIHELQKELESQLNGNKIVLMCEKIVPCPDDCLGDLMSILWKKDLTFKVALEVVGG